LAENSIDVVFLSNFLEYLKIKQEVLGVLLENHRGCRLGGHVPVLQPNIRYLNQQHLDFFDHHAPLSDRSLDEALKMTDFEIDKIYPRFLPYTTKTTLPQYDFLVKIYLRIPPVWRLLGKQAFVVGIKL